MYRDYNDSNVLQNTELEYNDTVVKIPLLEKLILNMGVYVQLILYLSAI